VATPAVTVSLVRNSRDLFKIRNGMIRYRRSSLDTGLS
jgi:hypothetical protein